MTKGSSILALTAFACLIVSSAQAQVTRTFVSGTGTANSTCSYTTPCRFFTQAVAAMPAGGGEIDVLDPGSYGQITIDRPLSIIGRGWTTITATSSTAAITITNPGTGAVSISGVQLDGGGTGQTGIAFSGGGTFTLLDSIITHFAGNGISIANVTAIPTLILRDVVLTNNTGDGLYINPQFSNYTFISALNITSSGNKGNGVHINASSLIRATFDHLTANENGASGLLLDGNGFVPVVTVMRSQLNYNNTASGFAFDIYNNNPVSGIGGIFLYNHNTIGVIDGGNGSPLVSDSSNNISDVNSGSASLTHSATQ
jgi:hypothetical protein